MSESSEEAPAQLASVDGFWMDQVPVTNAQFEEFVKATDHRTIAEIAPDPSEYPGAKKELMCPGSLVFKKPGGPVDMRDFRNWWKYVLGADWRHPIGPNSTIRGRSNFPVVHVAYGDAEAYARWRGKSLPTEAEWEFAARGDLDGAEYAWGNELMPDGRPMVYAASSPWQDAALLHSEQPAGRPGGGELRSAPAADPDPAQGDQRGLAPVLGELLPPLSARGPVSRADRHVDLSPGIQVHHQAREGR